MTRDEARIEAEQWVETEWGRDGGAVAETARLGAVSDADKHDLHFVYGADAGDVASALVELCKELVS